MCLLTLTWIMSLNWEQFVFIKSFSFWLWLKWFIGQDFPFAKLPCLRNKKETNENVHMDFTWIHLIELHNSMLSFLKCQLFSYDIQHYSYNQFVMVILIMNIELNNLPLIIFIILKTPPRVRSLRLLSDFYISNHEH